MAMTYTTMINRPGFMPETEPIEHETWEEAVASWAADIHEHMWQRLADGECSIDRADQDFEELDDVVKDCLNLSERERRLGIVWAIGGFAYSIVLTEPTP